MTNTGATSELVLSDANADYTLAVLGRSNQTGGIVAFHADNNQTATINISGNWSQTGGTIKVSGSNTNAQIHFNKTGTQTFTTTSGGATVTGLIDFTVDNGSLLSIGGTAALNVSVLKGRNFTLSSSAGIEIGSTAGIASSGTTGSIQNTGTRSFDAGANYTYNNGLAGQNISGRITY